MRSMGNKNIKIKKNDLLKSYSIVKQISENILIVKKLHFLLPEYL